MSHLLWELTKNNNAFLVKRGGVEFSSDPFNLTNINTYSTSGLVHEYGVAISATRKDAKKANPVAINLRITKRRRWIQKSRKVSEKKGLTNANFVLNSTYEHVPVNSVHKASKVIYI